MTVKELRYLVDNLDEYIHVPGGIERLKKTVLHLAVSGQLVPQNLSEGTGEELYQQIQAEKAKLIAEGKLKKQKPLPAITEAEIPFAIPKTWKWVRLQELVMLITDGTHHTPQYRSTGVPFLSIKDISAGALDFTKCKYISKMEHDEINRRCNPEYGDILFCRIGTLGRPVVVNVDEPFSIFVSLGLIKFDQKKLLSQYLKLFLEAPQTYRQYSKIMAGGSHTNKLNLEAMKSLVVVLPPTYEQVRIVKKVDAIFALIDELAEKYKAEQGEREKLVASSLAQLARGNSDLALTHLGEIIRTKAGAAQLRKTILHLAVSGQLVPQDPSEGTGEELFRQIQAEKAKLIAEGRAKQQKPLPAITGAETPFTIPNTWKWVRFGDVYESVRGITFPGGAKQSDITDGSVAVLRSGNLQNGLIQNNLIYVDKNKYVKNPDQVVRQDDVIVSMANSRELVGKSIIICDPLQQEYVIGGFLAIFRPHIHPTFFQQVFSSDYARSVFLEKATQVTNIANLSLKTISLTCCPLPPLAEQTRIVQKTTQLLDLITNLEPHLEK